VPSIDLDGFLALFVGNAETVLDYASGERIDDHDVVVRFNRAFTDGIEDKVGRRTDILVANRTYNLAKAPSPATTVKPRCVVCFVEPGRDIDLSAFRAWVGDLPTWITLAPDLVKAGAVERMRPVTMGTNALYALTHLLAVRELFLTGFGFYGAAGHGHGVYWQEDRKSRGVFHDLEEEARLFVNILQRFDGAVEATPEVEALIARFGGRGSGAKGAGAGNGVGEFEARLGWRLIRWGMRLRRRAELRAGRQLDKP
jgi:hypothetical protein